VVLKFYGQSSSLIRKEDCIVTLVAEIFTETQIYHCLIHFDCWHSFTVCKQVVFFSDADLFLCILDCIDLEE